MSHPKDESVRAAVNAALGELIKVDDHLLHVDCSERSITHQLAVHLSKHFPGYHVDCEYNRDGFNVKKLQLAEREVPVADDALDAVTVFPDVIVHIRGTQEKNLLVVEVKKASSMVSHEYDIEKLKAFKEQLGYAYAVHIVVGYSRDGKLVSEQEWQ
ncbi:hypothetical protein [Noviherbaspirillum sp.]|uniref:hypothetical protein n=1 Tax=Noviherbaspirillum sp. TaxID=1926288 RepID=UPI002B4A6E94|nr:hypothetical protein [Noviherbaspirillum sp.]HJV81342.1 hypothetical protein [Noviherbaspirillum sp.]